MRLQGVRPFSMALIAAIWNGSCMKARLGTVLSSKVRMSRGVPQGAPESPVIFIMIMELVLRDLIKSWITQKLAWRLDDFDLLCGRCGAGRCVGCCCGSDGGERERERQLTILHTPIPKHTPPPTQQKHDVFTVMKKDTQATCEYPNRCQKLVFVLKFVVFLVSEERLQMSKLPCH